MSATPPRQPRGFNWGAFGFSMLQVFLPVVLALLQDRVERPSVLEIQPENGLGNLTVTNVVTDGKKMQSNP